MEETLGKRIATHRRRLGLTQDALAELLGVTAQAVSKWENDQSCPDIATLPKLAEIFGVTTDELLGIQREKVHEAEIVMEAAEEEENGACFDNGKWEFQWDGGRKNGLGLGIWVLLSGVLLLLSNFFGWNAGLWDILWPTGLAVFGVLGLWPKFSFFRLGCALLGGYFLLSNLNAAPFLLGKDILFPALLVLFGLSLLADALRKPKVKKFEVHHDGVSVSSDSGLNLGEDTFTCNSSFGQRDYRIDLPVLAGGRADSSFGELRLDVTGCQGFAPGCQLELNCSFGEMELLVPRTCRVSVKDSASFASVETKGYPNPDAQSVIIAVCSVSFGEITIRYV